VHKTTELVAAAEEGGLDTAAMLAMLATDQHEASVRSKDNFAKRGLQCSGVPFFLVQDEENDGAPVAFSGAQPPETIEAAIRQALED
jgi:predicted DsbA family dithiol-disulfide isomerase